VRRKVRWRWRWMERMKTMKTINPKKGPISPNPNVQAKMKSNESPGPTMPNAQESHGILQHGPGGIVALLVLVGDVTMDKDLARFST
jgi:hypothetical protein